MRAALCARWGIFCVAYTLPGSYCMCVLDFLGLSYGIYKKHIYIIIIIIISVLYLYIFCVIYYRA